MTITEEQIFLSGVASQVKIAASALKFARDIMTPEQAAQIDFDFDKGTAEGFRTGGKGDANDGRVEANRKITR